MARASSGGIDPRYPAGFQRGGPGAAPVVDDGVARGAAPAAGRAAIVRTARATPPQPSSEILPLDVLDDRPDERHFELVVAGNPWLRALWIVGAIAVLAGFALTVYAEFAFSVPPASGIYDPSVYVVPRIAEAVAQPLVIAGVIAIVAATALRIVAWRPSRIREVISER
ncbi:hypothetical protein [Microcella sp.]|uniref:hypothetical protein n=1 Tax=Microcella sp. TaxID=1913979 RepID=UPI00391970F2